MQAALKWYTKRQFSRTKRTSHEKFNCQEKAFFQSNGKHMATQELKSVIVVHYLGGTSKTEKKMCRKSEGKHTRKHEHWTYQPKSCQGRETAPIKGTENWI